VEIACKLQSRQLNGKRIKTTGDNGEMHWYTIMISLSSLPFAGRGEEASDPRDVELRQRWICIDDSEAMVVSERHVQCGSGNVASRLTSCFLASITLHQDVTSLSCCIQIPDTLFFPPRN
jgi:hypothetical protein